MANSASASKGSSVGTGVCWNEPPLPMTSARSPSRNSSYCQPRPSDIVSVTTGSTSAMSTWRSTLPSMTSKRSPSVLTMSASSTPTSCTFVPAISPSPLSSSSNSASPEAGRVAGTGARPSSIASPASSAGSSAMSSASPSNQAPYCGSSPHGPTRSPASAFTWRRKASQSSNGAIARTNVPAPPVPVDPIVPVDPVDPVRSARSATVDRPVVVSVADPVGPSGAHPAVAMAAAATARAIVDPRCSRKLPMPF